MINETDVIESVCNFLKKRGFNIEQRLRPTQRGIDIIASKIKQPSRKFLIEAKGATSSKEHTKRYKKPFTRAQVRSHIAVALFKISEILSEHTDDNIHVGIALPDNQNHQEIIGKIDHVLKKLDVIIFWVDEKNNVQTSSKLSDIIIS